MFSQRDEEKYILQYFKNRVGRFLDIGAYDGVVFSNTRALVLQGWGGVCVEASPSLWEPLTKLYQDNENVQVLTVGIGCRRGVFPFYDFHGDAIGSFDKNHADMWSSRTGTKYDIKQVPMITMLDLFEQVGYDFQFVNIDAEGISVGLLMDLPLDKLSSLEMICVEFDKDFLRCKRILDSKGFQILRRTAENIIGVRRV